MESRFKNHFFSAFHPTLDMYEAEGIGANSCQNVLPERHTSNPEGATSLPIYLADLAQQAQIAPNTSHKYLQVNLLHSSFHPFSI